MMKKLGIEPITVNNENISRIITSALNGFVFVPFYQENGPFTCTVGELHHLHELARQKRKHETIKFVKRLLNNPDRAIADNLVNSIWPKCKFCHSRL